jgi:hypothetical protein
MQAFKVTWLKFIVTLEIKDYLFAWKWNLHTQFTLNNAVVPVKAKVPSYCDMGGIYWMTA